MTCVSVIDFNAACVEEDGTQRLERDNTIGMNE